MVVMIRRIAVLLLALVLLSTFSAWAAAPHESEIETPYAAIQRLNREKTFATRIPGGKDVALGDDPWQVGLLAANIISDFDAQFCGGVWIGGRTVVTSAHCVVNRAASDIHLIANVVDLDSRPQRIAIKKIWPNMSFQWAQSPPRSNDLVVLELYNDLPVHHLAIPEESTEKAMLVVGAKARVTGWGVVNRAGDKAAILQGGQLLVSSMDACRKSYGNDLKANQFCAGTGKPDTCRGDSGGPLSIKDEQGNSWLVGLITWGPTKCGEGSGVYTRVVAQRGYITEQQRRFTQ
jgi:secreted trypsin-like serine protease